MKTRISVSLQTGVTVIAVLLVACVMGASNSALAQSTDLAAEFRRAEQYFLLGEYERAVDVCVNVRLSAGESQRYLYCEATMLQAAAQLELGQEDNAGGSMQALIDRCPDFEPGTRIPTEAVALFDQTKERALGELEVTCAGDCVLFLGDDYLGRLEAGETEVFDILPEAGDELLAFVRCGSSENGAFRLVTTPVGQRGIYDKKYAPVDLGSATIWCGPECDTLKTVMGGIGALCATMLILELMKD